MDIKIIAVLLQSLLRNESKEYDTIFHYQSNYCTLARREYYSKSVGERLICIYHNE